MTIHLVSNASQWHKKWSTWLAVLAASAAAGLGAYAIMPERAQLLIPDWALMAMGAVSVVSALLVPLATAIAQPKITPKE